MLNMKILNLLLFFIKVDSYLINKQRVSDPGSVLQTVLVQTILHCGNLCDFTVGCSGFRFNRTDNMCFLHKDTVISDTGDTKMMFRGKFHKI